MKKITKICKISLYSLLGIFSFLCFSIILLTDSLPERIFLLDGDSKTLNINLPFLYTVDSNSESVISLNGDSLSDKLEISSQKTGTAELHFDLLGLIPVKNVSVTVGEERMLVPGGQSIGVMLYTDGALIVGCSDIELSDGTFVNPGKEAGLKPGDVIKSVNGTEIQNASHLTDLINNIAYGDITLGIERDGKQMMISVQSAEDSYDDKFRLGLWVRDSTAGVGTLTYYDPVMQKFGGLGHAITDVDTGELLSVKNGEVIFSEILEVVKSSEGSPGSLRGSFDPTKEVFGDIIENTNYGLYGNCEQVLNNSIYPNMLPAGSHNDVHTGPATILCSTDSSGIHEYECEIISVARQFRPSQKSFVIEVKDEELLNITGGIVQGMSGSPVIQDGKLIGAVTHVLVNEPTRGYGLYIDWMLEEMEN